LVIIVPTLALTGCCAGLFVLHQSFNIVSELPSNSDARIGFDVLAQHFPPGELAPIEIAINGSRTTVDPSTLAQIDQLTDALRRLPGVAGVRSVTQPLGAPITPALLRGVGGLGTFDAGLSPAQVSALTAAANAPGGLRFTGTLLRTDPSLTNALGYFLGNNGRSTRLVVTLAGNPYGPRAIPVTRDIALTVAEGLKSGPLSGAQTVVGGPSVAFGDIQVLASGDLIRIIVIVLALVFLVLVVLLKALIAPLYLIATVVLSYGAALGVTAFVFAKVLNQGPLSFWVPTFLFVILVALGADYTVFVMGRIREARSSGFDVPQAAVEGLVASGPVISAAGLILAGTFLALLLTPLPTLREVGFAVGFGVLLDTFIVRPLLVPALTAVVGTRAFWPGGPLKPVLPSPAASTAEDSLKEHEHLVFAGEVPIEGSPRNAAGLGDIVHSDLVEG
jgi:RND superfamily putative drug exporter